MADGDGANHVSQALLAVIRAHGPADPLAWLERGWPAGDEAPSRGLFFGFYAGAGRRFGHARPALDEQELSRLREAGVERPEGWTLSQLVRAGLLLAAAARLSPSEQLELAQEAFRKGDNEERVSLLKALSLFPDPARFVGLAAEACRTHVQDVFEGLACDNPFPARHMPEASFNQLVMKALFTEVPVERIVGWPARNNPELRRMAADYAAERRAAGRTVPGDIARIEVATEEAP